MPFLYLIPTVSCYLNVRTVKSKFHRRSSNLFRVLIPVPVLAKRACNTLNLFRVLIPVQTAPRQQQAIIIGRPPAADHGQQLKWSNFLADDGTVRDGEALVGVGEAQDAGEVAVQGLVGPVAVAALGVGGQREELVDGAVEERGAKSSLARKT